MNKTKTKNTNIVEPIRNKVDIQRIIDYFRANNKEKYAVLFTLGVNSGLRVSDLLGFKVKDVYNKTSIMLREQKTGKGKIFPLKDELQTLLNDFCKDRNPQEWLFTGRHGLKLDRIIVYKTIVQACKDLNINANVGTHTMRKTFGYHHYKQFHDIALLQTIFNHYSPVVTKRYIGITQDEINESYLCLNLKPQKDEIKEIKMSSRVKSRRVESFINGYLKNGGKKHREFALNILELIS
jgi:integrase